MLASSRKRVPAAAAQPSVPVVTGAARIDRMVREQLPQVWRLARRNGLSAADADDVAQRAMVIAAQRMDQIEPGRERAFLCGTVVFLIRNLKRDRNRHPQEPLEHLDVSHESEFDPESLVEQRRARERLDQILGDLPEELRVVFTLYEFESLSQSEIAAVLAIPVGTVASRLRRARELFASLLERATRPAFSRGAMP